MSTMETKMFSVWSVRWLYREYAASSTQQGDNWEVGQFSTNQYEDSFQLEFEVVNAVTVNISRGRSTQARQRIGIRSTQENKRSAGEELTQYVYSKIETVITDCKFRLVYNQ
jgi:hypothetical protein